MNSTSRAIFIIFLLHASLLAEPTPISSPQKQLESITCSHFLKQLRPLHRLLHSWRLNLPQTKQAIDATTGASFDSGDIPLIPSAPREIELNPNGTLKAVEDPWIKIVSG